MPNVDIASAQSGDQSNVVQDVTVGLRDTDGPTSAGETTWQNTNWTKQYSYYLCVPEVKIAIDMRAIWTIGKGYTAMPDTEVELDYIRGWGNDTFNSILKNMIVIKRVGGDAYCEIIRDKKGNLINLKPLNPGNMRHVVDQKGMLKRYEQVTASGKTIKFKINRIFHLMNKRVADEIHGVSDIDAMEKIIDASNESFDDMKQLMHRYVRPRFVTEVDSDNPAKITAFIAKFDATTNKGENLFIPKGTAKTDILSVPSNATLNPLPWRQHLKDYYFQVVGIPQIILGSSGEFTESTAKIAYLAFQQSVEDEQLDITEQVWRQLYRKIKLEFPASIQNELISDKSKDGANQEMGFQPNDTMAGVGA